MAVAELPTASELSTNSISQLEYIVEGYRYSLRTEIEDGKLTIVLRKIDESEDVLTTVSRPITPSPFPDVYRNALAIAVELMIAYEHRKDDE